MAAPRLQTAGFRGCADADTAAEARTEFGRTAFGEGKTLEELDADAAIQQRSDEVRRELLALLSLEPDTEWNPN